VDTALILLGFARRHTAFHADSQAVYAETSQGRREKMVWWM